MAKNNTEQIEFDQIVCPLAPCDACNDFHCENHPDNANEAKSESEAKQ